MVNEERVVRIGSWVQIRDGEIEEGWRIVVAIEADAARRLISEEASLARALLGHAAGEVVSVRGPHGVRWPVTILSVE
jgi:transcription elongation GreA/GreB family factor